MIGRSLQKFWMVLALLFVVVSAGCSGDTNLSGLNGSAASDPANPFTPTGTVNGVLRDTVTNVPIVGATIAVLDKKAVTGDQGQFTITGVPANTPVGNAAQNRAEKSLSLSGHSCTDTYPVVIDLTAVNTRIKTNNIVNNTNNAVYPDFAYSTAKVKYDSLGETANNTTTVATKDTPVDGFVASITPTVGKLDATIVLQVVDKNNAPQSGVSVLLYSTGATSIPSVADGTVGGGSIDTTIGNPGNVVASGTTDASGLVTFSKVEAFRVFVAVADVTGANGRLSGYSTVISPSDNQTFSYLNNQDRFATQPATVYHAASGGVDPRFNQTVNFGTFPDGLNDALQVLATDTVRPFVTATSPANLANVDASATTAVTFTFSKDMDQTTPYASALTVGSAVNGGLFKDVYVNFDGPKAGNIPAYTLAWTDARTLKVTFATQAASRYTVAILKPSSGKGLTDKAGNEVIYGASTFQTNDSVAKVNFTTNGTPTLTAPAPTIDSSIPTQVNWTAVTGAFTYNIYVTRSINGVSQPPLVFSVDGSTTSFDLVNNGNLAFTSATQYQVQVAAVSTSGLVGPLGPSTPLTITAASLTQPTLTASSNVSTPYAVTWTPITNAAGYNVYVSQIVNGAVVTSATIALPATATSFDVTTQAPGIFNAMQFGTTNAPVTYQIQVAAVNAQQVVGAKSVAFTVANIAANTPAVTQDPTNPLRITWPALPNVSSYVVHVTTFLNNVATGAFDAVIPAVAGQTTFSYTLPAAFMNGAQSYSLKVGARNNLGIEGADSAAITISDSALAAPTVTVSPLAANVITWNAVPKAASYNVYVVRTDANGVQTSASYNQVNQPVNTFDLEAHPIFSGYGSDGSTSYTAQVSTVDIVNVETQPAQWSPKVNFSSAAPAQVDATTILRLGVPGSLTYTFTAVPQASFYQVQVQATVNGVAQGWVPAVLVSPGVVSVPAALGGGSFSGSTGNFIVFSSTNFTFPIDQTTTYAFRIRAVNVKGVAGSFSDSTVAAAQVTELPNQNGTQINSVSIFPSATNAAGFMTDPAWDANTEPAGTFLNGAVGNQLLSLIDPTLPAWTASSVKTYGMKVTFNGPMKESDVETLGNWAVSKASNTTAPPGGGFADNATLSLDVIPAITKVIFDTNNQTAFVYFTVTQNGTNNATSDPRHVMFQYLGRDANGNPMSNPFSFDAAGGVFNLPIPYTPHP